MKKIQPSYDYDDLIVSGEKSLFGEGNAKLPLPPMLMLDRISLMNEDGGSYGKGQVVAELDICLLYTSPSPRDATLSRMPSSA